MASLYPKPPGWAIQWNYGPGTRRKWIRLPKMRKRAAEVALEHVENLIGAKMASAPLDPDTAKWLGQIAPVLRERIGKAGLIPGEHPTRSSLRAVGLSSIQSRRHDLSERARLGSERALAQAVTVLGDVPVGTITAADAKRVRAHLADQGLAEATVRKACSQLRTIMAHAVDARLIESNPFAAVPTAATAQPSPEYVSEADARLVLAELPDARWRLLFVLARWGGLRVPGEASRLRWSDVLWDRRRFRVESTKTAKTGKPERMVPLFSEVERALLDWREATDSTGDSVFPGMDGATGGRVRNVLTRAVKRSGVEPWGNLWRTLRASRQTDLEREYPIHDVCAWLGNTSAVAARHYLRVTDEQFERAAAVDSEKTEIGAKP